MARIEIRTDLRRPKRKGRPKAASTRTGRRPDQGASSEGARAGEVYAPDMHGAHTVLHVNMNGTDIVPVRSDRHTTYPIGVRVAFDIEPSMVRFFDPQTEHAISREA